MTSRRDRIRADDYGDYDDEYGEYGEEYDQEQAAIE